MLTRLFSPPLRRCSFTLARRYKSNSSDQGLPAPGQGTPISLDVSGGGSTAKLSAMGPLVVNVDGTVSRITNWAEMTDAERETTFRMVGKRNQTRLAALKKAKEAKGTADSQDGSSAS